VYVTEPSRIQLFIARTVKLLLFDVCVCVAKLVPLAYGIKKLQIACVVEDDKVTCLYLIFFKIKSQLRTS